MERKDDERKSGRLALQALAIALAAAAGGLAFRLLRYGRSRARKAPAG